MKSLSWNQTRTHRTLDVPTQTYQTETEIAAGPHPAATWTRPVETPPAVALASPLAAPPPQVAASE